MPTTPYCRGIGRGNRVFPAGLPIEPRSSESYSLSWPLGEDVASLVSTIELRMTSGNGGTCLRGSLFPGVSRIGNANIIIRKPAKLSQFYKIISFGPLSMPYFNHSPFEYINEDFGICHLTGSSFIFSFQNQFLGYEGRVLRRVLLR